MNKAVNVLIFFLGAGVGSLVTWKLVKTKYEQIAQEEIDSVKEVFNKRLEEAEKSTSELKTELESVRYSSVVSELGYGNSDEDKDYEEDPSVYVISPDEYGDKDYEEVSLTYYDDEILAYDNDVVVNNIDELIGLDSLDRFGEYEDNMLHVRNDILKKDFEIYLDTRNFADVVFGGSNPVNDDE